MTLLQQAIAGNAIHGLITGERGIGKTSLGIAIEKIARGNTDFLKLVDRGDVTSWRPLLVALVLAQRDMPVGELADAIARELERESGRSRGRAIDEVEIDLKLARFKLGSSGVAPARDPATNVAEFVTEVWSNGESGWAGILLIVDESDRVAGSPGVAGFFKALTELLARAGLGHVALLLVGTHEVVDLLAAEHESVPRILRHIEIEPLNRSEVRELFEKTLRGTGVEMSPAAVTESFGRSRGIPYLVQRLGFESWELLSDEVSVVTVGWIRRAAAKLGL